jgi:hypothetical protein
MEHIIITLPQIWVKEGVDRENAIPIQMSDPSRSKGLGILGMHS